MYFIYQGFVNITSFSFRYSRDFATYLSLNRIIRFGIRLEFDIFHFGIMEVQNKLSWGYFEGEMFW